MTIAKRSAQNFGGGALVRGSMAKTSYVSGSVGNDGWQIWTCINGSLKQRGVGGGGSGYAVGDQVTMIATGATYQLYLNGTLLGSWTDSAGEYPYDASYTYAGVVSWSARAFFSNYYAHTRTTSSPSADCRPPHPSPVRGPSVVSGRRPRMRTNAGWRPCFARKSAISLLICSTKSPACSGVRSSKVPSWWRSGCACRRRCRRRRCGAGCRPSTR
ncbi:hypothetical protein GS502_10775 [Rhodococcus hoagii]|nr:hypothetical protein [Prescottella equi]